jgi:hypothetical protein
VSVLLLIALLGIAAALVAHESGEPRQATTMPCDAARIQFSLGPSTGATGHEIISVIATNRSKKACGLPLSPDVTAQEPGRPDVEASPGGDPFDPPGRLMAALPPRRSGAFNLVTDHACESFEGHPVTDADTYHTLQIAFGGSRSALKISPRPFPQGGVFAGCGLVVGRFHSFP